MLAFAATLLLALGFSACGARIDVSVSVTPAGSGRVDVTVFLAPGTAGSIDDLGPGLPIADLRRAGWQVSGPRPGPAGGTELSASHHFASLAQLPVLMSDITGSGPAGRRPFRLAVQEDKGALHDTFRAYGAVDLRCSLACFDDPDLASGVGYPLGLPAAQLSKLMGPAPRRAVTFGFRLTLPGRPRSGPITGGEGSSTLIATPSLGADLPLEVSTEEDNRPFLEELTVTIGAGALIVLLTAALLIGRARRPRHRPGAARPGPRPAGPQRRSGVTVVADR